LIALTTIVENEIKHALDRKIKLVKQGKSTTCRPKCQGKIFMVKANIDGLTNLEDCGKVIKQSFGSNPLKHIITKPCYT